MVVSSRLMRQTMSLSLSDGDEMSRLEPSAPLEGKLVGVEPSAPLKLRGQDNEPVSARGLAGGAAVLRLMMTIGDGSGNGPLTKVLAVA